MILVYQFHKPVKDGFALLLSQAIDVSHVATDWEDALPPCYRVGANYWMNRFEIASSFFRRSSRLVVQLEAASLGYVVECWLSKGCAE